MQEQLSFGKINLRPLEPGDIDLLYQWENNVAIWEVSNTKTPFSKHILAQYLLEAAKDIYTTKQLRLVIETKENIPVGAIDLFDFEPYHQRAGVGILIHKNSDRRQGYAGDALTALGNYALQVLGLQQLYANITADNTPSIHLFEHAGYQQCGIKKSWIKTYSGWKDEILFQKLLSPAAKN
ncbi:GNAT family N-acetyltransferase [uncultured Draconibacterium sp.]|uniref:GNAT family N-acetyltransferase n=1 Tax=uncultured Draconibacterium sp. TaxID=1573823 RepID=UPI0032613D78